MKSVEQRRAEAQVRQEEYNKLTIEQKVLKLDLKLGGGLGAIRQRAKLFFQKEKEKRQPPAKPQPENDVKVTKKGKKFYQKPRKS